MSRLARALGSHAGRLGAVAALGVGLLLPPGVVHASPTAAAPADTTLADQAVTRYVALGDSLPFGLWDWRGGYVDRLVDMKEAQGVDVRLDNRGEVGARTADLLRSLRERPTKRAVRRADVITVSIGGNDLRDVRAAYRGACIPPTTTTAAVADRVVRVFRVIRRLNPQADVLTMSHYNPYVRRDRSSNSCPDLRGDFANLHPAGVAVNRYVKRQLRREELDVKVANVYRVFNVRNGRVVDPRVKDLLSFDGLHPNRDGHARIAAKHARLW